MAAADYDDDDDDDGVLTRVAIASSRHVELLSFVLGTVETACSCWRIR
jgi:hypothetical protein